MCNTVATFMLRSAVPYLFQSIPPSWLLDLSRHIIYIYYIIMRHELNKQSSIQNKGDKVPTRKGYYTLFIILHI